MGASLAASPRSANIEASCSSGSALAGSIRAASRRRRSLPRCCQVPPGRETTRRGPPRCRARLPASVSQPFCFFCGSVRAGPRHRSSRATPALSGCREPGHGGNSRAPSRTLWPAAPQRLAPSSLLHPRSASLAQHRRQGQRGRERAQAGGIAIRRRVHRPGRRELERHPIVGLQNVRARRTRPARWVRPRTARAARTARRSAATPTSASSAGTDPFRDRSAMLRQARFDASGWPSQSGAGRPRPTSHIVPSGKTDEKVRTIDRRSCSAIS